MILAILDLHEKLLILSHEHHFCLRSRDEHSVANEIIASTQARPATGDDATAAASDQITAAIHTRSPARDP